MSGHVTPSVPAIERSVLGAILREPALFEVAQTAGLDSDCFSHALYRQIWEAMTSLAAQGKKVDDLALIAEMPSQAADIAEVAESIATAVNFPQWLETLKEYKARRVLMQEAYSRQEAIGTNTDAKTLLDALEAAADRAPAVRG